MLDLSCSIEDPPLDVGLTGTDLERIEDFVRRSRVSDSPTHSASSTL